MLILLIVVLILLFGGGGGYYYGRGVAFQPSSRAADADRVGRRGRSVVQRREEDGLASMRL
jgi:hypothetical protein